MRTCPKCGRVLYDDNDFCVDDGMPLVAGRIGQDGSMSGTWTRPDGSKPRPFYLTAK